MKVIRRNSQRGPALEPREIFLTTIVAASVFLAPAGALFATVILAKPYVVVVRFGRRSRVEFDFQEICSGARDFLVVVEIVVIL